ncbi:MAG: hypothetical protein WBL55_15560, partial [Xanthobacteraceae bacterium]
AESEGNLFLGKPLPLHGIPPSLGSECPKKLPRGWTSYWEADHNDHTPIRHSATTPTFDVRSNTFGLLVGI